jgi:uncharacterized protein
VSPASDRRGLLLLPASKGKAAGGDGPAYPGCLDTTTPLGAARRELVDALLADLPGLDDAALARLAGVRAKDVPAARQELEGLPGAATMPAHRRYTGIVHGNAGLAGVDPADLGIDVLIVSGLAGLVEPLEPLPPYRVEFGARLPSLGGLATWWRRRLADHLAVQVADRRVWDLLPGEHARIWARRVREQTHVVEVAFVRPDGRAANAARTKVCKGRLAAFLFAHPEADARAMIAEADPGAGWQLATDPRGIRATYLG